VAHIRITCNFMNKKYIKHLFTIKLKYRFLEDERDKCIVDN